MPGKKPASARPSENRRMKKLIGPWVNAKAPETRPQLIMMRPIQRRGPDLLEDQIAWYLENKITPEKGAGAKPEDIRAEPDILVHGQCGKPDVHAIEIADEIKYEAKRQ